jgi:hypothetical protein
MAPPPLTRTSEAFVCSAIGSVAHLRPGTLRGPFVALKAGAQRRKTGVARRQTAHDDSAKHEVPRCLTLLIRWSFHQGLWITRSSRCRAPNVPPTNANSGFWRPVSVTAHQESNVTRNDETAAESV